MIPPLISFRLSGIISTGPKSSSCGQEQDILMHPFVNETKKLAPKLKQIIKLDEFLRETNNGG